MELPEAWTILGLEPGANARVVRSRYLGRLRATHPDISCHADANAETVELNLAFDVVSRSTLGPAAPPTSVPGAAEGDAVGVVLIDDDTIGISAPHSETYLRLVEACHRLGEITHLEPGSGLLSVVVSFVDAPTCQLLLTLQGRANCLTEILCTIESLEAADAPPVDAVTRLLFDELSTTNR